MPLDQVPTTVENCDDEMPDKKFAIKIKTPKKTMIVVPPTEEERQRWNNYLYKEAKNLAAVANVKQELASMLKKGEK